MKLPCELVQDLLPLYHDGVCSEDSAALVGEHLKDCAECSRILEKIDEEIQAPKLEADAVKPLLSIQVNWNRRSRRMLLKCLGAGAAAFLLLVIGWWSLTQWCIVPLRAEDYIIREAVQTEDGSIYLEYSVMYERADPEMGVTEDGVLYEIRRHPVLEQRLESPPKGSGAISFSAENGAYTWFDGSQFTAFCLGDPESESALFLWEKGIALPPAGEKVEEKFAQAQDTMELPDASENLWPKRSEPTVAAE